MRSKNLFLGTVYAFLSVLALSMEVALGQPLFEVFHPMLLAFVTNFGALFVLLLLYGTIPEYKKFKKLRGPTLWATVFLAVFNSIIAPYLWFLGWSLSSPNNAFLLGKAEMLFTVLLAALYLHEKVTIQKILGIIVMLAGIAFIANEGVLSGFALERGDMIILIACLSWALGNVVYKRYAKQKHMELTLMLRFFIGSTGFAILILIFGANHTLLQGELTSLHLAHLFAYVLVATILAKYFWLKSAEKAPLFIWSTLALASPVLGLLFNFLMLGELPQSYHYSGSVLIIVGFSLFNIHFHRTKNTHHLETHHHNMRS